MLEDRRINDTTANALAIVCPSSTTAVAGVAAEEIFRGDTTSGGLQPLHRMLGERMNGFPIHAGKVQPPPLRDQTLARDRLLDWLAAKIHQRVVLVIADAGYGKTTLLADFSERTRSADAVVSTGRRRP